MDPENVASSFRDPSGFLFQRDGSLYRQVNRVYAPDYDMLMRSGLYASLVGAGLLIEHAEVDVEAPRAEAAYKVLQPQRVPFISYPYEWCFSQLQDAAALTLEIQKRALDFGMSLKDASAYNVQFRNGRPVFIDTLSFEKHDEGCPWVAYRQFCQHFLAPLVLMSHTHVSLSQLLRVHLDGIPLDLTSALLPRRSWLRLSVLSHIHLHARSQKHYAHKALDVRGRRMSRLSLCGLLDNLACTIRKFRWEPAGTEWANYYDESSYTPGVFRQKKQLVGEFLDAVRPKSVWDLGANTGIFSRLAGDRGIPTIALDADAAAIEKNYRQVRQKKEQHLLPLWMDLTNPSGGIGWENRERMSLLERGPADMILALALVHHLAISNNVPWARIAAFLHRACKHLVIEFVPKDDPQVQRLLATRRDIFADYHIGAFEEEFQKLFRIRKVVRLADSQRSLYWMAAREGTA